MALHLNFNISCITSLETMNLVYTTPNFIHNLFPRINENEFITKISNYIDNDQLTEFNKKQYWIRYLLCCGDIDNAFNEITEIALNYQENIIIQDFMNHKHVDFNGNTLLHHALLWCPSINILYCLIHYGAETYIENYDGHYPEENIHRTIWANPFARILDMELVFSSVNNDTQQEIWLIRCEPDFIHAIHYIQNIAGERIENIDISNDSILNNTIMTHN